MTDTPLFLADALRTKHVGPVSFTIDPGETLVLTGPSGTGKSLLLRAMADLDAHEGSVQLDGREQSDYKVTEWRCQVGYMPAESAWWADSVGEHFRDPGSIDWAQLGFAEDVTDWSVARLSSGERQRLALLRLLENRPRVLLLDEPTANLDSDNTALVEKLVSAYQARHATACVWVSHDSEQAERLDAHIINLTTRDQAHEQ